MRHLILWLQNIVLQANEWILAKNLIFGDTQPDRFGLLYVPRKITKNSAKQPKIMKTPFLCHMIKIIVVVSIYVLETSVVKLLSVVVVRIIL